MVQAGARSGTGLSRACPFLVPRGQGAQRGRPPNNWVSSFAGGTWTRTTNPDGTPGEWYLHLFSPEQPDLNWDHPDVRREHEAVLRFWFDRGVAGVRVDSAALPVKHPDLPDLPEDLSPDNHPHLDREELHDIYRSWRAVADSYAEPRVLVGEVWLADHKRFARYLRADEMHTAFNFDFMARSWDAKELRDSIQCTLDAHAPVGAPATWVLSNHDVTRPVTRYGREDTSFAFSSKRFGTPTDVARGHRRARAAALLTAALPGCLYVYQGDELGLPEVEDLPLSALQDPMHFRSQGVDPGRDGCRVPLPWTEGGRSFGFSDDSAPSTPWLPQPEGWGRYSVEAQLVSPDSMLTLYRSALALRRSEPALREGSFAWHHVLNDTEQPVIAFFRGADFLCLVNLGSDSVPLPESSSILLASSDIRGHEIPGDTAVWLRL